MLASVMEFLIRGGTGLAGFNYQNERNFCILKRYQIYLRSRNSSSFEQRVESVFPDLNKETEFVSSASVLSVCAPMSHVFDAQVICDTLLHNNNSPVPPRLSRR